MKPGIGVHLGWKFGDLVVAHPEREGWKILHEVHVRREERSPGELLRALLGQVPPPYRKLPVQAALSSLDLACDLPFEREGGVPESGKKALLLGALHVEACSAGETLEMLSVDVLLRGGQRLGCAVLSELLLDLKSSALAEGHPLQLVTSGAAALALALPPGGSVVCRLEGERIEAAALPVGNLAYRSYPEPPVLEESESLLPLRGGAFSARQAIAIAVASLRPGEAPDLLRGAPGEPRTLAARLRRGFQGLAAGAAVLFMGLGLLSLAYERRAKHELALGEVREAQLFADHLPDVPARKGEFARAVRLRLKDRGTDQKAEPPSGSALGFFAEIARRLPDPGSLDLVLESLDLAPDGGRLSALVASSSSDPLRNAATLEARLDESPALGARADYEIRGGQVQVRLRLDYQEASR